MSWQTLGWVVLLHWHLRPDPGRKPQASRTLGPLGSQFLRTSNILVLGHGYATWLMFRCLVPRTASYICQLVQNLPGLECYNRRYEYHELLPNRHFCKARTSCLFLNPVICLVHGPMSFFSASWHNTWPPKKATESTQTGPRHMSSMSSCMACRLASICLVRWAKRPATFKVSWERTAARSQETQGSELAMTLVFKLLNVTIINFHIYNMYIWYCR